MLKTIKRIIIILFLIICGFVIQNTISVTAGDMFVTPNILIIITCLFGYMCGHIDGLLIGFVSGLLVDIFAADIIGMNALIYMYVGYFSGIFNRIYYEDMVLLPLGIVCLGDFIYNFSYYIFRFLVRNKLDFSYYMLEIILPEMVFTTFMALVLFKLIYFVNSKWLAKEQRSTLNFD